MGLTVVIVLSMAIIVLSLGIYRLRESLRELRNAHLNLAAEVGVVRREGAASFSATRDDAVIIRRDVAGLNERLVLLEIDKTATPKPPEEPPPSRRSFASQKARAEAGARKG